MNCETTVEISGVLKVVKPDYKCCELRQAGGWMVVGCWLKVAIEASGILFKTQSSCNS